MTAWLDILRAQAARTSQGACARLLNVDRTTINKILKGSYMASTKHIEAKVMQILDHTPWLQALRAEVARTSQARTSERLRISEATVSQVLSGSYKANTQRIERRVRGELMGEVVECRVLYDISLRVCQDVQERSRGAGSNPMYQQCFSACRGQGRWEAKGVCPNFCNQTSGQNAAKEST